MIDHANYRIAQGHSIAIQRAQGVNDNMKKPHYHEFYELYYLESGSRIHMADDLLLRIGPGDFLLFPPYSMHYSYGEKDMPFQRLVLYFMPETIALSRDLGPLSQKTHLFQTDSHHEIHELLCSLLREETRKDLCYQDAMRFLLNQLLVTLLRWPEQPAVPLPPPGNRMSDIIRYLNENYTDPISLEALASRFYVSPSHLCREFKKHTGSTVIQYVNELRILHARWLLLKTPKSVTEISRDTGFANISHFNRTYKAVTGMSPRETRQLSGQKSDSFFGPI